MPEAMILIVMGAAGVVLGGFFFGGLWWTVQRGMISTQPALWFLGSALLRMSVTLGGLYWLTGGQWDRLLVALLGFVMARLALTRLTRGAAPRPPRAGGEPWT